MNRQVRLVRADKAGARVPEMGLRFGRCSCWRVCSCARLCAVAGLRVLSRRVRWVRIAPGSMGRELGGRPAWQQR
jgi:hypothetical protein